MDTVPSLSPDAVLQALGDRLRQLRKSRQLRQFDTGSLGLSYKYYQRLESGQVNPTLVTPHKLANAFEVSVYDLFRPEAPHDIQAV